jgi:multidrug resistance efflux pump
MSASDLKPIPIPPAQRLRHFKTTFLPSLVFGGVLVIISVLWRDRMAAPTMVGQGHGMLAKVNSHQAGELAGLPVTQFQKVRAGEPLTNVLITDAKLAEAKHALPVNLRLPTSLQLCPDELAEGNVISSTQ